MEPEQSQQNGPDVAMQEPITDGVAAAEDPEARNLKEAVEAVTVLSSDIAGQAAPQHDDNNDGPASEAITTKAPAEDLNQQDPAVDAAGQRVEERVEERAEERDAPSEKRELDEDGRKHRKKDKDRKKERKERRRSRSRSSSRRKESKRSRSREKSRRRSRSRSRDRDRDRKRRHRSR
jgi:hypothetical protein